MGLFRKVFDLEKRAVHVLESSKKPFSYFILTFFFAVTLRNFLELLLDNTPFSLQGYVHTYMSYVTLALSLILLFYFLTGTPLIKTAKVILPAFIILILAPLLDFFLSWGKGYTIYYMFPDTHPSLALRFFTFFGDFSGVGITPGMRIEIAIVLLAGFGYFYLKNPNFFKSLFYTLLTYVLIFWYCALPYSAKGILGLVGLECKLRTAVLTNFYLFVLFLLGLLFAYSLHKGMFKAVIKDIRPFRLLHYELMFVLGLILGIKHAVFSITCDNIAYVVFVPVSIAFAWLYSVVTNNIEDYEIDKISNKKRPLVSSEISLKNYTKLRWPFLFVALFYSIMVNLGAFLTTLLFIGNYFFYSMPPLRLKRIPFFSKIFISLNSLILVVLGFILVTGSIDEFPKLVIAIFLIGFTAAINFIDIKDYKGDKKVGIKTLPVILGLKRSKFIIGLIFIVSYLFIGWVMKGLPFLFTFLLLGITQFGLLTRKNYDEKYVFLVYLLSLIMLIAHIWIFGV